MMIHIPVCEQCGTMLLSFAQVVPSKSVEITWICPKENVEVDPLWCDVWTEKP